MAADRVAQLEDRVSKSLLPFPIFHFPFADSQSQMAKGSTNQTLSQFPNIYFYARNANNLRFVLAKLKSHTEAEAAIGSLEEKHFWVAKRSPVWSQVGARRLAQECIKFKYYDHTHWSVAVFNPCFPRSLCGFTRLLTVETMLTTHGDPPSQFRRGASINQSGVTPFGTERVPSATIDGQ